MLRLAADYVQMNEKMARLGELVSELIQCIDELKENIELVDITWEGEANYTFNTRMEGDFYEMQRRVAHIGEFHKTLRKTIDIYQQYETEVMTRVKEVSV